MQIQNRQTRDNDRFIDVNDKYSACPGLQGQSLVIANQQPLEIFEHKIKDRIVNVRGNVGAGLCVCPDPVCR